MTCLAAVQSSPLLGWMPFKSRHGLHSLYWVGYKAPSKVGIQQWLGWVLLLEWFWVLACWVPSHWGLGWLVLVFFNEAEVLWRRRRQHAYHSNSWLSCTQFGRWGLQTQGIGSLRQCLWPCWARTDTRQVLSWPGCCLSSWLWVQQCLHPWHWRFVLVQKWHVKLRGRDW